MARIKRVRKNIPSAGADGVGVVKTSTVGGMRQWRCTCGTYAVPSKSAGGKEILRCMNPACGREFTSKKF